MDSEKIEEKLREKFDLLAKNLSKKAGDEISDYIQYTLQDHVMNDVAWNANAEIDRRATIIVAALLRNEPKYLQKYGLKLGEKTFNDYVPGEWDEHGVRRKILDDHKDFIVPKVIEDLEAEITRLKEHLNFARGNYS